MESNPYNLKVLEEKPSSYLTAEEFVDFLTKHKIPIKRMDNLPRFAHSNNIDMKKIVRDGSGGSVPTVYKIPNSTQISKIAESMKNNNNSELGKQLLKKKKEKILEIFDKAEDRKETRTSIADKDILALLASDPIGLTFPPFPQAITPDIRMQIEQFIESLTCDACDANNNALWQNYPPSTDQLLINQNFAGSFIGGISQMMYYIKPLTPDVAVMFSPNFTSSSSLDRSPRVTFELTTPSLNSFLYSLFATGSAALPNCSLP